MKNYRFLQQKFNVNTYPDRQLVLTKGDNVYLYDENNIKYLDMMSNYGVSIFGYGHKKIRSALNRQLNNLSTLHGSFNNNIRAEASKLLVQRCGNQYEQVYWSNSGTEAIEAALKFAVMATGKKKFIVCEHAYHGKTLGALSATDGDKYRHAYLPLLWDFVRIPFNDVKQLEKITDEQTAAFLVEPIQGEGGIIPPDNNYLNQVREICNKKNILLILDEIQSGTGRTGYFLASQEQNIQADIVCLGKGLAGGIPIGATVVNSTVSVKITKNSHTSTLDGNPLACAGVIAILNLLDNKLLNHIKEIGSYFINSLKNIKSDKIMQARGKGLMVGIVVAEDKRNRLLKLMQDHHILVISAGKDVVRFLPPYIIEKHHIDFVIKEINNILDSEL